MLKMCPEHGDIKTRRTTTRCPKCGKKLTNKKKEIEKNTKKKKQRKQFRHTNNYRR